MTRPSDQVTTVAALIAAGLNDCEVSRRTGIPRSTIRDWRRHQRSKPSDVLRPSSCPRCDGLPLSWPWYAYLLGMCLGDGCLSEAKRSVYKLRITLDKRYPDIIRECQ